MDLFSRFLVICIILQVDRLKSHTPFLCPASQLIYIFLKFQCVLCILNFTVTNKHPQRVLFQNQCLLIYHSCCTKKTTKTKDSALWDIRQNRCSIRFCSVYNNSMLSVAQKRIYPFQCLLTYAIAKQFALKQLVRWRIKCFLKIQYECSNNGTPLSKIFQSFITKVNKG